MDKAVKKFGLSDAQIIDAVNKGFSLRRGFFKGLIRTIDCLPFAYNKGVSLFGV